MNLAAGHLDGLGGLPAHYHLVMGGFAFGISRNDDFFSVTFGGLLVRRERGAL